MTAALAWLRSLVVIGARRPKAALALALVIGLASLALLPTLRISTSRRDLVARDQPYQARLVAFHERFGYPDEPCLVVSGGTPEDRRAVVDALEHELEAAALGGPVLGRITLEDVAELALLADPVAASRALGPDAGATAAALGKGLPGLVDLTTARLEAGLEADVGGEAEARAGLAGIAAAAQALEAALGGAPFGATFGAAPPAGFDPGGYLVGSADKHLVIALVPLESDEGAHVAPFVSKIRAARDAALAKAARPGVTADVTGLPAIVDDELKIVGHDLFLTGGASTLLILLVLWWAFRSLRQAMVSFLPLAFGTVVTFGIIRLTVGELNLITASFASVLLGLGDFGVHIQGRYGELLRAGETPHDAMEKALLRAGPGLVVGTVTTAVAFFTTATTEFTAFAQLGFITGVGLTVMLVGTYLVIPAIVLLLFGDAPVSPPEVPGIGALAGVVRRAPRALVAASLALTALLALGIPGIRFEGRYFDFLPPDTESARGLVALEQDPLTTPVVAHAPVASMGEARTLAAALRALPEVASVDAPTDWLPPLDDERRAALAALARVDVDFAAARGRASAPADLASAVGRLVDAVDEAAFALRRAGRDATEADRAKAALASLQARLRDAEVAPGLAAAERSTLDVLERALRTVRAASARGDYAPDDLPPLLRHRFVSRDGQAVAVFARPRGDAWDGATSTAFREAMARAAPEASGLALTIPEHEAMIVRGFERATLASAFLVLVILGLSFRSVVLVIVGALPLVLGSAWMLGAMPALGLSFNHANLVALPLLLGLGVECGAHVVHRYKQAAAERPGPVDLDVLLSGTGSAVLVASLTTVLGFSVLMLASYRAMYSLGLLMTVGMGATLLLSLVVLPACLVIAKKAR